jgi:hypothetical protein
MKRVDLIPVSPSAVLIGVALLQAALPTAHVLGADVSEKGIATVTLSFPYKTVLYRECLQFTVQLRNDSTKSLPYIADPYDPAATQVFLKVHERYQTTLAQSMSTAETFWGHAFARWTETANGTRL